MRFYMPTRLYCENDCVAVHAGELAGLGSHALIVTGNGSAKRNHSLADVTTALESKDIAYTVFEGVEENPSVETVMKAVGLGEAAGVDFVIGIGGGSPLDAAKAIALMLANRDKGWEFMYEDTGAEALPVVAVPTTCGTGSEVTGVAVLTRHDLKTKLSMKHKIFPKLALVDGKYIMSAPKNIIANTAVDALAHLIESAVNSNADYYSLVNSISGISLWRSCRMYIDDMDEQAAGLDEAGALRLMEASAIAGISIAQTGTSIPHALSYMVTYEAGIPHGPAVGMFLSRYLECADEVRRRDILTAAGFTDTVELESFIKRVAYAGADRDLLERAVENVLSNKAKLKICPFELDEQKLRYIAGL